MTQGDTLGLDRGKRPRDRAERIVTVAAQLFAERGYHAVGIDEIGEAVGITGPAVYRHFDSKEAILDAVASAADSRLAEALQSSAKRPPRRHQLERLTTRALKFAAAQPHLFRIAARREHSECPESRAAVLRAEVSAAIRAGQLRPTDPFLHARVVWAQLSGLADMRESGEIADDRELVESSAGTAWELTRGLRAR